MKKKFLILTLCFTLIFSSINYKKSFADAGVLSAPLLTTLATVAVACNVVLNNDDDIVDLGRMFYDKYRGSMNEFYPVFENGVNILHNGMVSISENVLSYFKSFLDECKVNSNFSIDEELPLTYINGYGFSNIVSLSDASTSNTIHYYGDFEVLYTKSKINVYYKSKLVKSVQTSIPSSTVAYRLASKDGVLGLVIYNKNYVGSFWDINPSYISDYGSINSAPNFGDYTWDNISDKVTDGKVEVGVPSYGGSLVGENVNVFNPSYDLPVDGVVTLPGVSNPSIDYSQSGVISGSTSSNPSLPGTGNPSLPALPSWGSGLDFSPVTNSNLADKFPFCLAKDISDIISVFDVEPKEPIFKIPFNGEELIFDLTEFDLCFSIIRFFILIGYIVSLIALTRGILG